MRPRPVTRRGRFVISLARTECGRTDLVHGEESKLGSWFADGGMGIFVGCPDFITATQVSFEVGGRDGGDKRRRRLVVF